MKLLLFDIDGTILKMKENISKKLFSENLNELFEQEIDNSILPDFHGMTDMEIMFNIADNINYERNKLLPKLNEFWNQLNEKVHTFCTKENIELMPGYPEILHLIENDDDFEMALLTGNTRKNAYSKLSAYSLGRFFPTGAFGDEDSDRAKLVPLAVTRATNYYKSNNFTSDDVLIIGDSFRDIECGRNNGIPVMAVATGSLNCNQLSEYQPDYLVNNFSEIDSILNTIKNHFSTKS